MHEKENTYELLLSSTAYSRLAYFRPVLKAYICDPESEHFMRDILYELHDLDFSQ